MNKKFICGFVHKKVKALHKQFCDLKKFEKYTKNIFIDDTKTVYENPYPQKIWTLWLQGYENAPDIVKICISSMKKYANNYDVVVLDENNLSKYITLPDFIMQKYKKGFISPIHFSDIVRLELLDRYGGTWIDSTVLCTGSLEIFQENELVLLRKLRSDNIYWMSSYFIHSTNPNNYLIKNLKLSVFNFWKHNNNAKRYFFLHILFSILLEKDNKFKDIWDKVPIFLNWNTQLLLNEFTKDYNFRRIDYIKQLSNIHKLSYKKSILGVDLYNYIAEDSYYNRLLDYYKIR